jgi:hypothetical protein
MILVALLSGATAHAADATWPTPHEIVYVSATLLNAGPPPTFSAIVGKQMFGAFAPRLHGAATVMPPCIPMEVGRVKPKKQLVYAFLKVGKRSSSFHRFYGLWQSRFHTTSEACEAYLIAHGEPKVVSSVTAMLNLPIAEHSIYKQEKP